MITGRASIFRILRNNLFLRLIQCVDIVNRSGKFPPISFQERNLIYELSKYWVKGVNISVMNAINNFSEMKSGTSTKYLRSLRKKGYLLLIHDEFDGRIKYIKPSNLLISYFNFHSEIIKTDLSKNFKVLVYAKKTSSKDLTL